MPEAWISTAWPLPTDSTSLPVTFRLAPVVMRFINSSSNTLMSATTWILLMVEPSLRAMNLICLLPLFVLTHPLARTSAPAGIFSRSLTFVLASVSIFLSICNCLAVLYYAKILNMQINTKRTGKKEKPGSDDPGFLSLTIQVRGYSPLRAAYMIFSAEHRRSSCFTSVMIPILTSWSAFRLTVMN